MARSLLNSRSLLCWAPLVALCIMISDRPANAKATYVTFGDCCVVRGINAASTVVGWRGDGNSAMRSVDGTITIIAVPGATQTFATGINDGGTVMGLYLDNSGAAHGFLRATDGTITSFNLPHGASSTELHAINNKNEIAGDYIDDADHSHGFVRTSSGAIKTFDPPGANYTYGMSINDKGFVTGSYITDGNGLHSFLRAADGTITTIDVPGADSTEATSINIKGSVAGSYGTSDGVEHGFIRASNGSITSFDEPKCSLLRPVGINRKGAVAGFCLNSEHQGHFFGFSLRPNGKSKKFQVPQGGTRTIPVGMNDAGVIAGNYAFGGFLRFP